jgi:hypothetical protein
MVGHEFGWDSNNFARRAGFLIDADESSIRIPPPTFSTQTFLTGQGKEWGKKAGMLQAWRAGYSAREPIRPLTRRADLSELNHSNNASFSPPPSGR